MRNPERIRRWSARLLTATLLLGATVLSGCYYPHYRHHTRHGGSYEYGHHDGDRDHQRDRHHRHRHHRDRDRDRHHDRRW